MKKKPVTVAEAEAVARVAADGFGLGGVLTPTGVGTLAAEGKRTLVMEQQVFLVETALKADVALIAARRADDHGNLEYALTAMAAALPMAEAEDIVSVGSIPPDAVVTPGVVVSLLVSRGRDA